MRGLEEIKQINANPEGYRKSREQADVLYPRGPIKSAAQTRREQAFHGERAAEKRRANRAEVR